MEKNAIDSPVPEATVPTPSIPQKLWTPLTISLTVLVVIIVFGIVFFDTIVNQPVVKQFLAGGQYKSDKLSDSNILPTSTPTPRAIPHGKKGFTVGQSDSTVPQLSRGFIDPYDPEKGTTQTVTIAVKYAQPVTKVTAVFKTDNAVSAPVPFTLTSGTNTNGEWSASWQVTDTYLYTYGLVLQAESAGSKPASVEITLR